jgi:hypothetical protein
MAQKGYLGNGPNEVWHYGPYFRMFLYHGHGSEARRPPVGGRVSTWDRNCTPASVLYVHDDTVA